MGKVAVSIMQAKIEISRPGWERISAYNKENLLEQINNLRIENDDLRKNFDYKSNEIKIFPNDLSVAFSYIFNENKHINKLRVWGSSTATILPKILDYPELIIDECVVLLRKLPITDDFFNSGFESEKMGLIERWKSAARNGMIKNLTIIEYDRLSDIWYIICDNHFVLHDLYIIGNKEHHNHYGLSTDKVPIVVSSITENGEKYIFRCVRQFDSYEKYYKEKCGIVYESEK